MEASEEDKLKRELIKSSEQIKRKYNNLKKSLKKQDEQRQKKLKPLTEPLEQLVSGQQSQKAIFENALIKKEEVPVKKEEPADDAFNYSIKNENDSDKSDEDDMESSRQEFGSPTSNQFEAFFDNFDKKQRDSYFAPKFNESENTYEMGDKQLMFADDEIIIDDDRIPLTNGILELLFKQKPNQDMYSEEDLQNYGKIINSTNVHRENYQNNGKIVHKNTNKYKTILKNFQTSPAAGGKRKSWSGKRGGNYSENEVVFPLMKKLKPLGHFTFWDDPNELVTRLKLLMASQAAGHDQHDSEILSILNELKQSGFIE